MFALMEIRPVQSVEVIAQNIYCLETRPHEIHCLFVKILFQMSNEGNVKRMLEIGVKSSYFIWKNIDYFLYFKMPSIWQLKLSHY
jgi:hypothetical protein